MKTKLVFNVSVFESISENVENKLIGGFSQSFSSSTKEEFETTNNCRGGNCSTGCGDGPIGQNKGCNVAAGCGAN
ncbi:hypothetical protein V1T75_09200 [Tenacibaculum sp. FZY0031]|uniref:hypothetical protein n=1 Tax=Tenacibaculum sp. FZY0031 TaxID=3116648 RepID=UPI002EA32C18|nr:hypothetical protein [Tenacibaculum sp. FZY0031]